MKKDDLNTLADDLGRAIALRNKHHVLPLTRDMAVMKAESTSEALLFLERASLALDAALDFQSVRECRDMGVALAAYAREAKDGSLMDKAARLRVQAERRAGEMLLASRQDGTRVAYFEACRPDGSPRLKLSDIGITRMQSSVWQQVAALPPQVFSDALAQAATGRFVTSEKVLKAARVLEPQPPRDKLIGAPAHRTRAKSVLLDATRQLLTALGTRHGVLMAAEREALEALWFAVGEALEETP